MIPVLVTCKDRIRYLDITLKSLSATLPKEVEVYLSDDGSINQQYLKTNEIIKLHDDYKFPNDDENWKKYIGFLNNCSQITGIKNKVNVFYWKKCRGILNFTLATHWIFNNHNCSHVIKIQDDVVLKKNWYEKFCEILSNHPSAGIVSGFRYFFANAELKKLDEDTEEIIDGYCGGLLMALSYSAFNKNPEFRRTANNKTRDMDEFWIDNCRTTGLQVLVTTPGMCQHIGYNSIIYEDKEMFGKKFRIDQNMFPPYELEKNVRTLTSKNLSVYDNWF